MIHGFRTVVNDIGANIGYIISSSGFQSGSFKASELTNIRLLDWLQFQNEFQESWFESYFSPTIAEELDPLLTYSEPLLPKWFYDLSDEDKDGFMDLKKKYDQFGWLIMSFTPYVSVFRKTNIPELPISEKIQKDSSIHSFIPKSIVQEVAFREFLKDSIAFGNKIAEKFHSLRDK